MRVTDGVTLALVRLWCFIRYPRICARTLRRSREVPDPATPTSYFDKYLWRKIFDHNPLFTAACDKLAAKKIALSTCRDLKTAKVLWVGEDAASIPANVLAGNVVVKANHGSRWNVFVRDGEVDRAALHELASAWMRRQYGRSFGEWAYKNTTRRLFVEEMLLDEDGQRVRIEYKFHVSGGRTAYVYVSRQGSQGDYQKCYLERDGEVCPASPADGGKWANIGAPATFDRMRQIAETLAAPFDNVRCDFYEVAGEIYFSELTVYPLSGSGGTNKRLTQKCNANWDLRKAWFLTAPQSGWRKFYAAALRRRLDATADTMRP